MKVIVCGAGQVGYNIAKQLAAESHDVAVIDWAPEQVNRAADALDVQALSGYASHPDVLERAGAEDADMIIAVTLSDEVNMVACQVAHSLFSVPTKIARIRDQSYLQADWRGLFSRDHLPIDVIISPEFEVAKTIAHRLKLPGAIDVVPFADDRVRVVGVRINEDCPIIDTPLRQLTELFPALNIVVVGISRDDKLITPSGSDHMQIGDEVYFLTERDHVQRSLAVFGYGEREARRVIIVGGGNVGLFLARELESEHRNVNVKIIEPRKARAEEIADQLSRTTVIHGDALDPDILSEANVREAEAVVSVANDDEINILSAMLAKRAGCRRTVTLINNPIYGPLIGSLGIDVFVNPRATTVSTILRHVRRGRIRGVYTIADGKAEVIEAEALETSELTNVPVRDMHLPSGILIGAIVRGDEVIVPRGDTVVKVNDRVILFALADMVKKVEELFSVRLEFF